jgi:hypothetical protein
LALAACAGQAAAPAAPNTKLRRFLAAPEKWRRSLTCRTESRREAGAESRSGRFASGRSP